MFFKKSASDKPQSSVQNIVTLNAYTDKEYIYKGNTFEPLNKLSFNKSNFVTSYVNNRDMITTTVHLSRSIPEEDIQDILDLKAYEELGLDQASNYIISSTEVDHEGEEREFHIFVAEPAVLEELFLPIKEQTKYIDLILPAPLLYKALYKKEILDENGTHCFIYFTQQDAFIAFYLNGEYLYSKSMDYSLTQLYDKYCEMVGEKVDEKEFFTILEKEGLKTAHSDYQQNLMKIFGEVFLTINDIIIYVKRAFQLETIEHMFIGSVNGPIIGLEEYSQNYLGLHSADLNFKYEGIENDEWYTDQFQYLMLLNALEYIEDEEGILNLTMFPRPPAFAQRASGQFIISTVAAITLSVAYPLVYLTGSYINDAKVYALSDTKKELANETRKYKRILAKKKKELDKLEKKNKKLSDIYHGKTKTLTSIYDKKVNYRLKSDTFHTIADELKKFDVHVERIVSKEDTVWLSLVSSDDRKMTELIKYISDTHFNEIKEIDIARIQKDQESQYYKGLLKVELK
jgi:hypothetical protein